MCTGAPREKNFWISRDQYQSGKPIKKGISQRMIGVKIVPNWHQHMVHLMSFFVNSHHEAVR
jgi:hypothetical protein